MTKLGIGLPAISVADVRSSAEAAALGGYDSFSVYGDLGDMPPYAALHAVADTMKGSPVGNIGPMGVPVGMTHPESITGHAVALEEQLPGQTSIGLVRGAFLETIGEKPASLDQLEATAMRIRTNLAERELEVPLYIGGFGPKILALAGRIGVQGIKLGGSTSVSLAEQAQQDIANPDVAIILGAVSVIDQDRTAARRLARSEVAKYLAVVGRLDRTLDEDDKASLQLFNDRFSQRDPEAPAAISDKLLDKFALAGTPEDALAAIERMHGVVDRFEFGTPHGLGDRPTAIKNITEAILSQL